MQQRILPKGKGLPWWQPSSDLCSSILANWRELTGSEFSESFGFGLCGLDGFALLRGLDKIFGGRRSGFQKQRQIQGSLRSTLRASVEMTEVG